MLLSYDGRWGVFTQTKCASNSLTSALRDVAYYVAGKHDMYLGGFTGVKYTCVRRPHDRWCSMYWYCYFRGGATRHAQGLGLWGPRALNDWAEHFFACREERPHPVWTNTCCENVQRHNLTPFKSPESLLLHLAEAYGYSPFTMKRLNVETRRASTAETLQLLTPDNRRQVDAWCQLDIDYFNWDAA